QGRGRVRPGEWDARNSPTDWRTIRAGRRWARRRRVRGIRAARSPPGRGNFQAHPACSPQHFPREQGEGLFDTFAGLGAGTQKAPVFLRELRLKGGIDFPVLREIAFVDDKNEGDGADFFADTLFEAEGLVDGGLAGAVGNQQVPVGSTQVGPAHFLVIVLTVNIPKHQGEVGAVYLHVFLVDLNADGGLVDVRVDAFNEAANEAGLPYSKATEHADFFLEHGPGSVSNRCYAKVYAAIVLPVGLGVFLAEGLGGTHAPWRKRALRN